jgi:hypothetical protein
MEATRKSVRRSKKIIRNEEQLLLSPVQHYNRKHINRHVLLVVVRFFLFVPKIEWWLFASHGPVVVLVHTRSNITHKLWSRQIASLFTHHKLWIAIRSHHLFLSFSTKQTTKISCAEDAVNEEELILCCALCCINCSILPSCGCFGCSGKVSTRNTPSFCWIVSNPTPHTIPCLKSIPPSGRYLLP